MDMQDQWNQRATILDGITAALVYIEGQVDDLRSIVEQEVSEGGTENGE
tara:strand:- start:316 stop:462 length:147 start_codon:yes stop_codon:yes gene_type:complete